MTSVRKEGETSETAARCRPCPPGVVLAGVLSLSCLVKALNVPCVPQHPTYTTQPSRSEGCNAGGMSLGGRASTPRCTPGRSAMCGVGQPGSQYHDHACVHTLPTWRAAYSTSRSHRHAIQRSINDSGSESTMTTAPVERTGSVSRSVCATSVTPPVPCRRPMTLPSS